MRLGDKIFWVLLTTIVTVGLVAVVHAMLHEWPQPIVPPPGSCAENILRCEAQDGTPEIERYPSLSDHKRFICRKSIELQ